MNDNDAGKPEGIHLMIGRRPYAAFGNSTGDRQMLEYTGAGDGPRLMMLVLHDDNKREYAYGPARGMRDTKVGTFTQALYDEAKKKGWTVISMKDWEGAGPPAPAPALRVGDRWVYNCSDGYRVPVTWVETHQVIAMDATGISVRVTLVGPTMDYDRVERWQAPGIVLIGSIYDDATNRTFKAPYTRYQFPLTPGGWWRQTVEYPNPANGLEPT